MFFPVSCGDRGGREMEQDGVDTAAPQDAGTSIPDAGGVADGCVRNNSKNKTGGHKARDFRDEKETHLEGRWATDTNCKMISNLLKAVRDVLLFETMAKAH